MARLQFFDRTEPIILRRSIWAASILPELISEDGDVFLCGCVRAHDNNMVVAGFLIHRHRLLVRCI